MVFSILANEPIYDKYHITLKRTLQIHVCVERFCIG